MNPKPAPSAPRPRVVIPGVTRRDILIGVLVALGMIAFIVTAVFQAGQPPRNMLSGTVRERLAPGPRETIMTVSRKGVSEKTADTGYSLKVWVESQKREYEVMVMKEVWEKKKVGDTLEFLRPQSEQH